MTPINLKNHTIDELTERLVALGLRPDEARRIFAAIIGRGEPSPAGIPRISKAKKALLAERTATPALEMVTRSVSPVDNFTKYLFRLQDGHHIEAVRIPLEKHRYTVCLSSQVGCPLGCAFCATGRLGFIRNLEAWEIVDQFLAIRREADRPITSLVFMGMGEPLLNYDAVITAARMLSDSAGGKVTGRSMTISTAGITPAIHRFTEEGHPYQLAISLTAATSEKRRLVMPVEDRYPLPALVDAIRAYQRSVGGRVMIEYVAIADFNCRHEDALALNELLRDIPIKLSLIEVNDNGTGHRPPGPEELESFRDSLQILRAPINRRYSGGKDIEGACGMLAARALPPTRCTGTA